MMCISSFSTLFEIPKIGLVYQGLNFLQKKYLIVKKTKRLDSHLFTRFQLLLDQKPLTKNQMIEYVIRKPLYEEFFFRVCIQGGIFLIQRKKNENQEQDEVKLRRQKMFRIFASALLFGFSHFIYQPLSFHQMKNVMWICLTGVIHGYISESCGIMAESYLIHGMNNALCCAKNLHPQKESMLKSGIYLLYFGLLTLFAKEIYRDLKSL